MSKRQRSARGQALRDERGLRRRLGLTDNGLIANLLEAKSRLIAHEPGVETKPRRQLLSLHLSMRASELRTGRPHLGMGILLHKPTRK